MTSSLALPIEPVKVIEAGPDGNYKGYTEKKEPHLMKVYREIFIVQKKKNKGYRLKGGLVLG